MPELPEIYNLIVQMHSSLVSRKITGGVGPAGEVFESPHPRIYRSGQWQNHKFSELQGKMGDH